MFIFRLAVHWSSRWFKIIFDICIGGSKGAPGTRAPPGGPNSFIFMQFSAKIINKHTHFWSWRPPPGENPRSATDIYILPVQPTDTINKQSTDFWPSVPVISFNYIYVSLRLRVQNAVSAQPCVGKLGISLVLLNFLDCNFRLWFETP